MSAVIVCMLPVLIWLRLGLLVFLLAYGASIFWQYALLRAAWSVIAVKKLEDKRWQLTTRSDIQTAALRGDSTVTAYVSVLRFDIPERKKPLSCIIFRDSLAADEYRRLTGAIRS